MVSSLAMAMATLPNSRCTIHVIVLNDAPGIVQYTAHVHMHGFSRHLAGLV